MAGRMTKPDTRSVNLISHPSGQSNGSIVPFRPGGAEGSVFLPASTLDVMEVHHDLRKFIPERSIAESCGVLSSGREARGDIVRHRTTVQHAAVAVARLGLPVAGMDRQIDNVKRLTPRWRIESLTKLGSDQAATEALQEAETEVGVVVKADRTAVPPVGGWRSPIDRPGGR